MVNNGGKGRGPGDGGRSQNAEKKGNLYFVFCFHFTGEIIWQRGKLPKEAEDVGKSDELSSKRREAPTHTRTRKEGKVQCVYVSQPRGVFGEVSG